MIIEFQGTCSDKGMSRIAEKGGRRFSYKRQVKLVKNQYPEMYEALSLHLYNPWENDSRKINYEGRLYLNLVWSDIDHIFLIVAA
jgi:hypothetical protein